MDTHLDQVSLYWRCPEYCVLLFDRIQIITTTKVEVM